MANLEIEGKIKLKLAVQSGQSARGEWAKQDFVLEYMDGNYPADICISVWGQDKVAELNNYQVGDAVKVSFNVRAREYNGRWYNDIRAWKIAVPGVAADAPAAPVAAPAAPAPAPMRRQAPAPAPAPAAAPVEDLGADDDMPF
ncbi:MAG: DUF3127 domain-containing protein [Bacteroidales bacterium]|nr:DUF3127 domain-containing protein [Bacteroidales bacterium]